MRRFNTTVAFDILGNHIILFASETAYGNLAVAELDNTFHQLGNQPVNISTAIRVWEYLNNRLLTNEELDQVIIDNGLSSGAI